MTAIDDLLARYCFELDGDGRWFTNRHQFVRLSPDGTWLVLQVVAKGQSAGELATKAHHPRWLDQSVFGDPEPPVT